MALASGGSLSVAELVTLFLVTSTFVGQIAMLANHLPDIQAGLGAVIRLRQMMGSEPEPEGGEPVPGGGALEVDLRDPDRILADAQKMVEDMVTLPTGYSLVWSGQYEYMQRAAARLVLVVPAAHFSLAT